MARTMFEFYCSGGCQGYILIPLDDEIDEDIILVCPQCKHAHYRRLRGGQITQDRHATQHDTERVHQLEPTMAAYSTTPRLREESALGQLWSRLGGRTQ